MSLSDARVAKLREWKDNPVTFVREVFGAEPDAWQAEVLMAFAKNNRLALKSSKGPGKTTLLSWCGWNYLVTRPHPKIPCISITGDNLRDNLWTEFAKWQNKSEDLKAAFEWTAERITLKESPQTWYAVARQWSKSADRGQQSQTLAGIHADFVLFLVDEAGGIPDAVIAAAEAGLANASEELGTEAKLLIAGNPTDLSGPLWRACNEESHLWWVKSINSDPENPLRAPRVSKQWAQEQIDKYGRDNPWVIVNVFGEFPPGQSNTLISMKDCKEAAARYIPKEQWDFNRKVLGIDVARFGDDRTVIFARQGPVAFKPWIFRNLDTMEVVGQVVRIIRAWQPNAVFVDQTGVGGGVVDRLNELGYKVIGVDFSGKSPDPRYYNMRAAAWGTMGEWLKKDTTCIPNMVELITELSTPQYKFSMSGQIQLEAKADIKKRGNPSPDLADALSLTHVYEFGAMEPMGDGYDLEKELKGRKKGPQHWDYDPYAGDEEVY